MKTVKDIEKIIQNNKKELKEKYGLREIGIFGFYVRGEQDKNSDIDILVPLLPYIGRRILQEVQYV